MSFDEQPDGDPHGECAFEIARLEKELSAMTKQRDHYLNMNTMLQKECAELRKELQQVKAYWFNDANPAEIKPYLEEMEVFFAALKRE